MCQALLEIFTSGKGIGSRVPAAFCRGQKPSRNPSV